MGTGLRANELASLTRRSFDLADETATVTIEAAHEKARRGDTLPLPPDLAERLRPWLATLGADEPLWPGKWAQQKRASKFLQVDLSKARQAWLETADDDAQRIRRTASSIATETTSRPTSMRCGTRSCPGSVDLAHRPRSCNGWPVTRPSS